MGRRLIALIASLLVVASIAGCRGEAEREIVLATTTSVENSGLLEVLLPRFEEASGYRVRVIAVGSGAALRLGERGDADMVLAHAPQAEQTFMDAGFGVERTRVMHNDFVIVGPAEDPAQIEGTGAAEAFRRISAAPAAFASRGDDSGTHETELLLWKASGRMVPSGEPWYIETGQGMTATLTIAAEREAYVLTDRATWLEVADPSRLPLLVEDGGRLHNVYHAIIVNPERHEHVNAAGARELRDYLVAEETQRLIGEYGVERFGESLFTPSAE